MKRKRVKAAHGEKTIELTVRFWTNNISRRSGYIVRRECWDRGVVYVRKNLSHGISVDGHPIPFNSLPDLANKVEEALFKRRIVLHLGSRSRRLFRQT